MWATTSSTASRLRRRSHRATISSTTRRIGNTLSPAPESSPAPVSNRDRPGIAEEQVHEVALEAEALAQPQDEGVLVERVHLDEGVGAPPTVPSTVNPGDGSEWRHDAPLPNRVVIGRSPRCHQSRWVVTGTGSDAGRDRPQGRRRCRLVDGERDVMASADRVARGARGLPGSGGRTQPDPVGQEVGKRGCPPVVEPPRELASATSACTTGGTPRRRSSRPKASTRGWAQARGTEVVAVRPGAVKDGASLDVLGHRPGERPPRGRTNHRSARRGHSVQRERRLTFEAERRWVPQTTGCRPTKPTGP